MRGRPLDNAALDGRYQKRLCFRWYPCGPPAGRWNLSYFRKHRVSATFTQLVRGSPLKPLAGCAIFDFTECSYLRWKVISQWPEARLAEPFPTPANMSGMSRYG